ncbi:hypothetical protein BDW67DRAFT_62994 [Aspergillus spinulosporus]
MERLVLSTIVSSESPASLQRVSSSLPQVSRTLLCTVAVSSARHRYSRCQASHATCQLSLGMLPGDRAGSQDRTDPELDQVCTALCAALDVGSEPSAGGAHRVRLPLTLWGLGTPSEPSSHCDWRNPGDQWTGKATYTEPRIMLHSSVAGSRTRPSNNRCRALAPYPTIQASDRICCPSSLSSPRLSYT